MKTPIKPPTQIPLSQKDDWHFQPPSRRAKRSLMRGGAKRVRTTRTLVQREELLRLLNFTPANEVRRVTIKNHNFNFKDLELITEMPPKCWFMADHIKSKHTGDHYVLDDLTPLDEDGNPHLIPDTSPPSETPTQPQSGMVSTNDALTLSALLRMELTDHIVFRRNPALRQVLDNAHEIVNDSLKLGASPEACIAAMFATIAKGFTATTHTRRRPNTRSRLILPPRGIKVIRREYEPGRFTNDIYVDARLYTPAVGDALLSRFLRSISRITKRKVVQ